MKKQLFLSLAMAMAACTLQAQVLNGSFENLNGDATIKNWDAIILLQISVGIDSTGGTAVDSVVTDGPFYFASADAHSGNYALEMHNAYYSASGEQIAGRAKLTSIDSTYDAFASMVTSGGQPAGFNFYYKFFPYANDTAFARLTVYDSNANPIGEALAYISGTTSSYTLASIPVTYTTSDTAAFISIDFVTAKPGSAANFGTRFLVDDVQLNYAATGIAEEAANNNRISCFPNPATQQLNLRFNTTFPKETSLCITDVCGKLIGNISYHIANDVITADVAALPPGVYLATVVNATGRYTTRFVK